MPHNQASTTSSTNILVATSPFSLFNSGLQQGSHIQAPHENTGLSVEPRAPLRERAYAYCIATPDNSFEWRKTLYSRPIQGQQNNLVDDKKANLSEEPREPLSQRSYAYRNSIPADSISSSESSNSGSNQGNKGCCSK